MDFRLSPAEARFQREVHDWLVANLPAGWGTPEYRKPEEPAEKVQFARRWQGKLCDGGRPSSSTAPSPRSAASCAAS